MNGNTSYDTGYCKFSWETPATLVNMHKYKCITSFLTAATKYYDVFDEHFAALTPPEKCPQPAGARIDFATVAVMPSAAAKAQAMAPAPQLLPGIIKYKEITGAPMDAQGTRG